MADLTSQIAAVASGDGMLVAWVQKHEKARLHIIDARGRTLKLPDKLHLVRLGTAPSADAGAAAVATFVPRIEAIQAEIDTAFLWECTSDQPGERSLEDLAEAYFGDAEPTQLAALFAAVAADTLRFKTSGANIQVRTAEVVANQLAAHEREQERIAWREAAAATLGAILAGREAPEPPDGLYDRLDQYLLRNQRDELETILAALPGKQPPREKAFDLLAALGRLPDGADRQLLVAGYNPDFPPAVIAAAEAVQPVPLDGRTDFTHLPAVSIDDDDTREVDDAITVETLADGVTRFGIHIADASAYVLPGDALDREAISRVSTLYLPHRSVTMLPERISCDLASLHIDGARPTLSSLVEVDADGAIRRWELARGRLRVTHRLNYEQADRILAGDDEHPLASQLHAADAFTTSLFAERKHDGAIIIPRPELKVRVTEDGLSVKRTDAGSPSRRLIGELMILFNRLAANFAEDHGIDVIYRVQDPLPAPLDIPDTYDPVALDPVFRALRPSRLSVHPQVHAGLGLSRYVQATSPLRRYTDLIIQRQLDAYLLGEPPRYTAEELLQIIGNCLGVEQEYRAMERDTTRSLLLGHLRDTAGDTVYTATALAGERGATKAELDDFLLRGALANANRAVPGDKIQVRIAEADPDSGRLLLRRCT